MRRRRDRMLRAALLIYTATAIAPNAGRGRLFLDSASVDAWRELLPTGRAQRLGLAPELRERRLALGVGLAEGERGEPRCVGSTRLTVDQCR